MSDLGYLVCAPCKTYLTLGKPVLRDDETVNYYHLGPRNSPRNPAQTLLNESLWKFLADHTGHPLVIKFDYEDGMAEVEENYTEIGGDTADGGIPFEQYLLNWDGLSKSNIDDRTLQTLRRPAINVEHYRDGTISAQVALHVDLPPSLLQQWQNEHGKPLLAISVRDINKSTMLVRNLGLPAPFLLRQIAEVNASRVVFGHFEQLWTKNRPVAVELLHSLPRTLAQVRAAGRSLHIALADLSAGSADAILAELQNAPSDGIEEPITVIDYPTMP
ncbi:hypothetical protein MOQ72_24155 [Saccharopolyspora sp. K220]|uniref:hypothetical protein n=1 Tax=Saccharopolyspora soli TaxID=2926618 RepID=UPI001F55D0A9|nr:hypothetical protein [Saccharopolyspora soli]MCI2420548.1 hypothetical protein [Saccharopolyspora soli]